MGEGIVMRNKNNAQMTKPPTISRYASQQLTISMVKNVRDNRPEHVDLSWQEVIDACSEPDVRGKLNHSKYLKATKATRDKQKDGIALIGGAFSKSNTRSKADVKSICIVTLDFDDGHYSWDELIVALNGIECVVFTTYSHSERCGKYRALVLLKKPITKKIAASLDGILDYFESLLGPHLDKASRIPSQTFYTPSYPPGGEKYFRCWHIHGKPLCIKDILVTIPNLKEVETVKAVTPNDNCRPGDDFNGRISDSDVLAMLESAGWRQQSSRGGLTHLSRPGKKIGISASWGFHGTKLLYIHSNDPKVLPFEIGKSYSAFAIYALLKHGGDFSTAARQLASEGYGEQNITAAGQQSTTIDADPTEWPELHKDSLPGWIGEFVQLACEHSEAHEAAVLITLILRFAAEIIGPYVNVGDSKQRSRTNAVIVGTSGKSRKGTSSKPVERLFYGLDNCAQCTPGPLSSGEGLIYAVRDERQEYDKKLGHEVVVDPGATDKRLFVLEEEFGAALICAKREGNTLSAIIRGFYDDGNAEPLTRNNKIKATGAHVVIVSHITTVELSSLLDRVQMANGFANRFLWVLAYRKKLIAMPQPMPAKEVARFQGIITKHIEAAKELEAVAMSEKALKLWEASYPSLTMGYEGAAGSVVNRSEAHAIRLALIYALAAGHSEIKSQDLKAALALVKYSQESAFTIFKGCQGDKRKEKILQALRNAPNNKMSLTEISSSVFNRNVKSGEIDNILMELKLSKLLTIKSVKTSGAPKKLVILAPVRHD
jgi:hypothetical protein